jgi:D-3-phosphoglycerate dehydrogenase
MIAVVKHFVPHLREVKTGNWKRITGNELAGKTLGVLGMGRIGKEVIKRGVAFDMTPIAFDTYWDDAFASEFGVKRCDTPAEVLAKADVVSLHMPMTDETAGIINKDSIATMRDGAVIINTARGGLVVEEDMAEACRSGKLAGYGTDVLCHEPMPQGHVFQDIDNIVLTPHVGSRTRESVGRQAMRATNNLINYLEGNDDFIQANKF